MPTLLRSNRAEVRNPLLTLPSTHHILAQPPELRFALAALLMDLRADARAKADKCWKTGKAPMAAYWKAVSVYAGHTARLLKRGAAPTEAAPEQMTLLSA